MKSLKVLALMLSLTSVSLMQSCKSDEAVKPAPTVTATSVTATVGTTAKVAATINVPAGLKSITVTKNGVAYGTAITGTGELTYAYSSDFAVDNTLKSGDVVTFTLTVTDNANQVTTQSVTVTVSAKQIVVIPAGSITADTKWTSDKIYKLMGFVRVGDENTFGTIKSKATLTIEAGTLIVGDKDTKGTLIIQRGSKIIAQGTAANPIIMTSAVAAGDRQQGDWGGLVICGQAPNNLPDNSTDRQLEGGYGGYHGGTDAADNSGILKYVRVEYAGIPINPNQEVNSFTFASVGSGTTVDYVQASYGLDDSFEWFGGTVNCSHLIAYKGWDDDFDTDNGFSGYVQFGLGIRDAALADASGSNGFECDNDANGSANTPYTSAIFANMSIIGGKGSATSTFNVQFQNGAQLRRNNKQKIYNTVITGYPNGLYVDSQKGDAKGNAAKGDIDLKNVVLAGVDGWGTNGWGLGFSAVPKIGVPVSNVELPNGLTGAVGGAILIGTQTPTEWFTSLAGNKIITKTATTGLSSTLWANGRPTLILPATATDLLGATLPSTLPTWFTKTTYVGAFDTTTDWTATWAEFSPQSVVYIK
jgi:hypothetical protein